MSHITDCLTPDRLDTFRRYVNGARRVVVTCHLSPDGDALGSSLAIAGVLRQLGKTVDVILPDTPSEVLMFLPGARKAHIASRHTDTARILMSQADLILCMDFNALHRLDRLGAAVSRSAAPKVMIDHHINPESWPALTFSAPDSSSTCLLLYHLLMACGMESLIDRQTATCIYTGMMTDTGNFSYNSNDPDIYLIIARLMEYGIDKNEIYRRAMGTFSADSIRLCAYALLDKMMLYPDVHMALIVLSRDELAQFNYQRGDTESLVNKPLEIPDIRWSVFMRQDDDLRVKVSMRSLGSFAVNTICTDLFGGGGHHNAAGGDWHGPLDEAVNRLLDHLSDYIPVMNDAIRRDLASDPFSN